MSKAASPSPTGHDARPEVTDVPSGVRSSQVDTLPPRNFESLLLLEIFGGITVVSSAPLNLMGVDEMSDVCEEAVRIKYHAEQTHGFVMSKEDCSGRREVAVAKFDDGSIRVMITTKWNAVEEPVVSRLFLTHTTLLLLRDAFNEAATNLYLYPTPKENDEQHF